MSDRMITIHDMETDEIVVREMTEEEFEIQNTPGEFDEQMKIEAEAKAAIRASAIAKLEAIGLTTEEANAFLG